MNVGMQPRSIEPGFGFRRFAQATSRAAGTSVAFAGATLLVIGWAIAGPFFEYSDSWELVINTLTTIITFLMVFLIQNTQNRDAMAMHLKLDELVRAVEGARNSLLDLENVSDEELTKLKEEFGRLSKERCELIDGSTRKVEPSKQNGIA
jgi:low affinity Fe/Cu permease